MQIQNLGGGALRLKNRSVNIVLDPYLSGKKSKKGWEADVILVSQQNDASLLQAMDNQTGRYFAHPGEYEVSGTFIHGFDLVTPVTEAASRHTTFYTLNMDEIVVGHLGPVDCAIEEELLEQILPVDVLSVQISMDADRQKCTADWIRKLKPKVLLPLLPLEGTIDHEAFGKLVGMANQQEVDQLKLTNRDIPELPVMTWLKVEE